MTQVQAFKIHESLVQLINLLFKEEVATPKRYQLFINGNAPSAEGRNLFESHVFFYKLKKKPTNFSSNVKIGLPLTLIENGFEGTCISVNTYNVHESMSIFDTDHCGEAPKIDYDPARCQSYFDPENIQEKEETVKKNEIAFFNFKDKAKNPTEESSLKNPTKESPVKNPTEELQVENPTEELQVENPTEELQVENPTEELPVENPTEKESGKSNRSSRNKK